MLVLGVLCLVGFAVWEHIYKFPLLNPSVWMNRNYTLCVLCKYFSQDISTHSRRYKQGVAH